MISAAANTAARYLDFRSGPCLYRQNVVYGRTLKNRSLGGSMRLKVLIGFGKYHPLLSSSI
jgi:hypothetical protein